MSEIKISQVDRVHPQNTTEKANTMGRCSLSFYLTHVRIFSKTSGIRIICKLVCPFAVLEL